MLERHHFQRPLATGGWRGEARPLQTGAGAGGGGDGGAGRAGAALGQCVLVQNSDSLNLLTPGGEARRAFPH